MSRRRTPKYRHYKPKNLGMVVIDGHAHYLGKYDSPESRERYHRLVAELHAGRHLVASQTSPSDDETDLTVNELILAYARFADSYYVKDGRPTVEPTNIRLVLRLMRRLHGTTPAKSFGPLALKAVREEMIRAGNCRREVNRRVGRIVRMFKWAVSEELVPPSVFEALRTVSGLRKGRSNARENPPVRPVSDDMVQAIKPFVNRHIWAMIELQSLTGMRPGEVVLIRPQNLDMSADVWVYCPERHKTEHHEKQREVLLGPRAREVLLPWLTVRPTDYFFSPAKAIDEQRETRRQQRKTPVQPSQQNRRKSKPRKKPGDHYTVGSYRRAIQMACVKAGIPKWHPHQLRHTAATEIRKRFGIEATRIVLGHEDVRATQLYAEEDRNRGVEIMRVIG
jgi:integrase